MAGGDQNHHHRATTKKENRAHKTGKHASKSLLKDQAKGRSASAAAATKPHHKPSSSTHHDSSKAARKNKAKQVQLQKRKAFQSEHVLAKDVPRVVTFVKLCQDIDMDALLSLIFPSSEFKIERRAAITEIRSSQNRHLQILLPEFGNGMTTIDALQASDFVILCLSSSQEVEEHEENILRLLTSVGAPAEGVRSVVATLPDNEPPSILAGIRKSLLSFTHHFFPDVQKVYCPEVLSEAQNLVRTLVEPVPKGVSWREERARILAEETEYDPATGSLALTGFIRGAHLSADRLLHLPYFGDFQIQSVTAAPQASTSGRKPKPKADAMDTDAIETLDEATEDADDLQSTNVPDEADQLLNEQTWPTEEEIANAPLHREGEMLPPALPGTTPKRVKRVPKGTSDYQAAWIVDEEDDDELSGDDLGSAGEAMADDGDGDEDEDARSVALTEMTDSKQTPSQSHAELPMDEEMAQYQSFKQQQKARMTADDVDFPDEVDTPQDIPARERFARYRGLKSFRTSPWDPYENLPIEYSRCFMFANWKGTGKRLVRIARETGVKAGMRVTIRLKDVPSEVAQRVIQSAQYRPITALALHKHEHKYSVLHFAFQRNTEFEDPVKSKDEVILQLGPRRFRVNPLYSQHTQKNNGKGSNNVHKFHRFLPSLSQATTNVGSCYLPITFGTNLPAVLIDPKTGTMIGSGSLMSCDPTRILAKRIILTGHPYKIHKRTATIRYLFFNPEDIAYFKPVQLRTKKGKIGHIHESLGTHGYLKAGFDAPLDQMDTICLNLYKRCFPKWSQLYADNTFAQLQGQPADVEMES